MKKTPREKILELFKKGKVLYYSDIVKKTKLDLELVVNTCNQLEKDHLIKEEVRLDAPNSKKD